MSEITQRTAVYAQQSPPTLPAPPVPGKKVRKEGTTSSRRVLWILVSIVLLALSIGGFYITALRADDTQSVLVASAAIPQGEEITSDMFTTVNIVPAGGITYTSGNRAGEFVGMTARGYIPSGTPVQSEMFFSPVEAEEAVLLECVLDFEVFPGGEEVASGDFVLMIDPGEDPGGEGRGTAAYVVEARYLDNLEESQLRESLPPNEWSECRRKEAFGGRTPQVYKVNPLLEQNEALLGTLIQQLNTVFEEEFVVKLNEAAEQAEAQEQF